MHTLRHILRLPRLPRLPRLARPRLGLLLLFALGVALGTVGAGRAEDAPPALPAPPAQPAAKKKRVAAIVTVYRRNSHADVIVSRFLKTETLDGKGRVPSLELVSLYVDQRPENDTSQALSETYGVPIYPSIREALTLGGDSLAVDGVILIGEHGDYPKSPTGNTQFPKRRFFDETVGVFKASDRVVPIYMDKHIADNWTDIAHIEETAAELHIPMIAGSVLPLSPRLPPANVPRGAKLEQLVVLSYGRHDSYDYHALELAEDLAARRAGGETGIAAVQMLTGDAVWALLDDGRCDQALFDAALALQTRKRPDDKPVREVANKATVMVVEYLDGLRVYVFNLNRVVDRWTVAWKVAGEAEPTATAYALQEGDPYVHFALISRGIEELVNTGKPPWSLDRTVLVSGALDELLRSLTDGGTRRETPMLHRRFTNDVDWEQPAAMFLEPPRPK